MKGDFTRMTFDQSKHYRGVVMQQGRVQLDADWNENLAIESHLLQTLTRDVIGEGGVPVHVDTFKIDVPPSIDPSKPDFKILAGPPGQGRMYVSGLLIEIENDTTYLTQPDWLSAPSRTRLANLGPQLPAVNDGETRVDLVYVDVWPRTINAIEDPYIREVALGGPDTAERVKLIWQVKVKSNVGAKARCNAPIDGTSIGGGTAQLVVTTPTMPPDPCEPTAQGGYQGPDNRFYRIEIHDGGPLGKATFKWSRDNGSVIAAIERFKSATEIVVKSLGRDDYLKFKTGDFVEVSDDATDLSGLPGVLAKITVDEASRMLTLNKSVPEAIRLATDRHPKVRRWDGGDAQATAAATLDLEAGLKIQFGSTRTNFRSGDYWTFAARVVDRSIDPHSIVDKKTPTSPMGVRHAFCNLALITWTRTGNTVTAKVEDCRTNYTFPPLTDITAGDVSYENARCQPALASARTVQQAIDLICQQQQYECTVLAVPGPGWEAALNAIADGQDAKICFQIGTYLLDAPIVLRQKGHLTISGCGPGTKIIARYSEVAFRFEECKSVTVHNLSAICGITGTRAGSSEEHLNGVLSFYACPAVTIEHVALKCAAGGERAASCITIAGTVRENVTGKQPISARIQHCDLRIGHMQAGIVLLNVTRARVMDNLLRAEKKPKAISLRWLLENRRYRSAIRSLLVNRGRLEWDDEELVGIPEGVVVVWAGRGKVWFSTDPSLVPIWEEFFLRRPPKGVQNNLDFLRHAYNLADELLLNQGRLRMGNNVFEGFRPWYLQLLDSNRSVASQGIVVAGTLAKDIQIHNNTIYGVHEGIHMGFGMKGASFGLDVAARRIEISSNNIGVFLSPGALNRYAIFVGSCDSLTIQHNYAFLQRSSVTANLGVEGVRIYGILGRMMIARHNHFVNFTTGIYMHPLKPVVGQPQWLITDNLLEGTVPVNRVIGPTNILGLAHNYS